MAQEDQKPGASEAQLIKDIALAEEQHGFCSKESLEAIARLIGAYAANPSKRPELKQALGYYIGCLQERFGASHRVLHDPLAMLTELQLADGEYEQAIFQLVSYRTALLWGIDKRHPNGTDPQQLIPVEHNLALALKRVRRYEEAEKVFREYVPRIEQKGGEANQALLAEALESWTELHSLRGDYPRATETALRCLAITRQLPNIPTQKLIGRLQNVKVALNREGRERETVPYAEEIAKLENGQVNSTKSASGEALHELAVSYASTRQYDKALTAAKEGLQGFERTSGPNSARTAFALNTLARLYVLLERPKEAIPLLERALRIDEAISGANSLDIAGHLVSLALARRATGDVEGAISALDRCQKILAILETQTPPDEVELAKIYLSQSSAYLALLAGIDPTQISGWVAMAYGDIVEKAMHAAARSAEIRIKHLPPGHNDTRTSFVQLGRIQSLFTNKFTEALATLHKAMDGAGTTPGDGELTSLTEMLLCLTYAVQQQGDVSILWGKEAVNTLQSLRADPTDLDPALRADLEKLSRDTYEIVATLLVHQGRVAEAQQILQMLKEHELYDSFRGASDDPRNLRAELTGLERQKFARFYELRDQQIALAAERLTLARKREHARLTSTEQLRLDEITGKLQPVQAQAMKGFIKQLEADMAAVPSSTAVQNSASIGKETGRLRAAINRLATTEPRAGAVGLQYLVGKDKLTIILTIPGAPPIAHQRPIDRPKLYAAIKRVSQQMQSPNAAPKFYEPALRELHEMLIEPVAADLKRAGARTLMLSLDDQLRLLPFAALLDKNHRYLMQDYTLALYNEAAAQTLQKPGSAAWRVAAMGLSEAVDGKRALSAVPEELAGILKAQGVVGDAYLNRQFTHDRLLGVLKQAEPKPYNVLHVASHFVLKPGQPAESFLYLGDGSRYSLADMGKEALSFSHFDLVTYSACQTAAAGGRDASGQEMESLSAKTQRQGAQAVMATLWNVSDQSTGYFMRQYYAQRKAGLNKAEALRTVQLAMAAGHASSDSAKAWMSPHHWASFVLAGNWR